MRRFFCLLAIIAFWQLTVSCAARMDATTVSTRTLAPGVTYTQEITTGSAPLVVNILRVDLNVPGVSVRCGQAQDSITLSGPTKGREPVHSLATRNGALAAVNADFFPFTSDALGLAIRDGELLSEPMDYRACLGIGPKGARIDILAFVGSLTTADGQEFILDGINRLPGDGETVLLTPTYAATPALTRPSLIVTLQEVNLPVRVSQAQQGRVESVTLLPANTPLPACPSGGALCIASGRAADVLAGHCKSGETLHFRCDLAVNGPVPTRGLFASRGGAARTRAYRPVWADVQQAVGGGPWLVRNGDISVDGAAESFAQSSFVDARHARTAVGVMTDNRLLIVTVDGKQSWSRGVSLGEMASLMKRLGAVNALNLDGGGSTTMYVDGGIVNAPSDGRERAIADSLMVYANAPETADPGEVRILPDTPDGLTLPAGGSQSLQVVDVDGKPLPSTLPILWGTGDGLGLITQNGVFASYHAGSGTITAHVGAKRLSIPVRVLPGTPSALKGSLGSVANNPPDRLLLTVTVLDRWGNPIPGVQPGVEVHGGQIESPLLTDAKGQARSEIVWDAAPGQRVVVVTAGTAPPLTLKK